MAAFGSEEWSLMVRRVNRVVVRELRGFEVFHPVSLMIVHVKPEEGLELLIVALRKFVCLRVVRR